MSEPAIATIEKQADVVVVRAECDRLDENSARRLESAAKAAGAQALKLPFVVDLSKVTFLSSLSLGALVRLSLEFRKRSQRLIVASLQPAVREVFDVSRLDQVMELRDTVDAALMAIRNPQQAPPQAKRAET